MRLTVHKERIFPMTDYELKTPNYTLIPQHNFL